MAATSCALPSPSESVNRPGWWLLLMLGLLAGELSASAAGSILREVFGDIPGNSIGELRADPRFPARPSFTQFLTEFFETPTDSAEQYGQRVHGYVVPPVTGNYTFWIASDDNGELYLSTDNTPARQKLIASVPEWTSSREWEKFAEQKSVSIRLVAGQAYYIQALHKEGNGGDNLAVRWKRPDGVDEGPIPAKYLLPWGTSFTPPVIAQHPTNLTVMEGQRAEFSVRVSNLDPVVSEWRRNGELIPGASELTLVYGPVTLNDQGSVFRARLTNSLGATESREAVLTVLPDTIPPQVLAAFNIGTTNLQLLFSESIGAAGASIAGNFTLDGGVTVLAARLGTDPTTVILTTSSLTYGTQYSVGIQGLVDQARTPNPVAPGAAVTFLAAEFVSESVGAARGGVAVKALPRGGFELTAAGTAIGDRADQFGFAWQLREGDFDLQVRLGALRVTDPYLQAGLMARADLATNAPFAGVVSGSAQAGVRFLSRTVRGGGVRTDTPAGGFPYNGTETWLRLQRTGNVLTGFASLDGLSWMRMGNSTVPLGSPVYVGLVAASRTEDRSTVVRFHDYGTTTRPTVGEVGAVLAERELPGPSSRRTGLVFSEIMYHPGKASGGTNDLEFVELYNAGGVYEDLGGWRLAGAVDFTFPPGFRLEAGAMALVSADPLAVQTAYQVPGGFGPWTGSLNNGGERIELRDATGAVKLAVDYSPAAPWPAGAAGGGHSLILARPSFGEADPRAWAASERVGGSPGTWDALRPSPLRGVVINEFLAHTDDPVQDFVELYNGTALEVDLGGCVLTDDPATNRFRLPLGTTLAPRAHLAFTQNQLGFRLSAGGEEIYLITPDGSRVLDAIRFGPQENGVTSGRTPSGSGVVRRLESPTPGAANSSWRHEALVFNELYFNPISGNDDDEFIELLNRSATPVNLSGWRLTEGVDYEFPAGTTVAPGGYVVVARNAARVRLNHPQLSPGLVLGNYGGTLANGGERIVLAMPDELVSTNLLGELRTNIVEVVVSEVTYVDEGRWSRWADGGGSSLELTDPEADPQQPGNWADSDESAKAPWTPLTFTGRLDHGMDSFPPDRIQMALQGAGECLVDDLSFSVGAGANLVPNAEFEASAGWTFAGNYWRSRFEAGAGISGSRALRLVGQGDGDTGPNCVRADLRSTPAPGSQGTILLQARWLRGWPEVLVRTRGNWIELAGRLTVPANLGSPGAVNSRRVANAGPVLDGIAHSPVLPAANNPVVVTARVADPDGIASVRLLYRSDPATTTTASIMRDDGSGGDAVSGDGIYSATLSGRSAGTLMAFRVEATDAAGTPAQTVFPPAYPDSEALIRWGDEAPVGSMAHHHLWTTRRTQTELDNAPGLNNRFRDTTLVVGGYRAIYGAGFRPKGSPFHGGRGDFTVTVPADDRFLGVTDRVFAQTGNGGSEDSGMRGQIANWMAQRLGIPYLSGHYLRLYVNGSQYSTVMEDLGQPNNDLAEGFFPAADQGDLYKIAVWFEFGDDDSGFNAVGATLESLTSPGLGLKPARYRWNWQTRGWLGTANNLTNVFNLVSAANATTDLTRRMQAVADMEQWMRVFAFNRMIGNWDSWTFSVGQNMYLYFQPGQLAKLLPWDIDFVLGLGDGPSSALGAGSLGGNSQDPVANRFYDDPAFRRALWRAYADAVAGPMRSVEYQPQIDARAALFRNNGFGVGGAGEFRDPRAIATYIEARRSHIQQQMAAADRAFGITSNSGNDFNSVTPTATLTGTAPFAVAVIEVNGVAYPVTWTTANAFRILVPLTGPSNPLTLTGYDLRGRPVPGATDTITVTYPGAVPQPEDFIVINEIQYDPAIPNTSFIEIHNRSTTTPFSLSGWRLEGVGYTFPDHAVLTPNSHLVLVRDRQAFALAYGALVAAFDEFPGSLDNGGETLRLVKPGATPDLDRVVSDVRYDDDPPWPAAAAGTGPSLQLVDPTQDPYRVGNWVSTAAGDPDRATPGRANAGRATLDPFPPVWINEVLARNVSGPEDNRGEREPFIEMYNAGSTAVDLSDFRLSDKATELTRWSFPPGTVLGAGQFFRVWADGESLESAAGSLHTAFRIAPDTGLVLLSRLQGNPARPVVLDFLNYAQLPAGRSAGCYPDGEPRQRRTFSRVTPGAANDPTFPSVSVAINEFMASNQRTLVNPYNGRRDDWFELFNAGTSPVDLTGYFLSDSLTNTTGFEIPPGFVVPPGGFLLVWADDETRANTPGATQLHVNFKLAAGGEDLALYAPDGALVDGFTFGAQGTDVSQGRFPDGASGPVVVLDSSSPGGSNEVAGGNRPPVLAAVPDQSVTEGALLKFGLKASDDPAQTVRFSLAPDAPPGAVVNETTGQFTWTPTESQGPGLFVFTARATDNGTPARTGGTRVTVRVGEVNRAPEFRGLTAHSVDERSPLRVRLIAEDPDLPANTVSFSLEGAVPSGVTLDAATGDLAWIPTEAQGPGTYTLGVRVTDHGEPPLHATGTFTVTVNEVNNPPDVADIQPQTVSEGQPFAFQIVAADPDSTASPLVYSLEGAVPSGLQLDARTGRVQWNPGEADGPSTAVIVVRVTEQNAAALSATRSFSVTVAEANQPPQLGLPAEWTVEAGDTVAFRATAADADLPVQTLTFSLDPGMPPGAEVDGVTGEFRWTVDPDAVAATHRLILRVTDDGPGGLSSSGEVRLVVRPRFQVVVQEIMAQPAVARAAYVELGNVSARTGWDLSGHRLEGDSLRFTFPAGTRLEPGAVLCVAADAAAFKSAYGTEPRLAGTWTGTLGAAGDTLRLLPPVPDTTPLDAVRFRTSAPWPAATAGGGAALQLVDARRDNARVANWSGAPVYTGPRKPVVMGSVWRYFQSGPVAADWASPDFADAGWPEGGGLFHAETATLPAPKVTPLTLGQPTYYFRTAFVLPEVPAGASLKLSWIVDDGAVFYLNGVEIHRWNLPAGAAVDFNTAASPNVPDAVLTGPVTLPGGALRAGTNVLAVEVHQARIAGGDVVMGCALSIEGGDLPGRTPGVINNVAAARTEFAPLWINEVLPSNTAGRADVRGDRDPWIELINTGSEPVSLAGWYLTDSYAQLKRWPFAADAVVPARGFLVVFADGEPDEGTAAEPHTAFRLATGTGSVALVRTVAGAAEVADYLDYQGLKANESLASQPDGQPFSRERSAAPTPGVPNVLNRPPEFAPVAPLEIEEGRLLAVTAAAFDPDFGQTLTYRLTGSVPPGLSMESDTGRLTWTPDEIQGPGVFRFGIQVSDGGTPPLIDEQQVTVTVREVNRPPTFFPIPDQEAAVGVPISLRIGITDPDLPAQTLAFTLIDAPPGVQIHAASGELTWTPTAAQAGRHEFSVRVVDGGVPPLDAVQRMQLQVRAGALILAVRTEADGTLRFEWPSVAGTRYRLETSPALGVGWQTVAEEQGNGGILTRVVSVKGTTSGYFRLLIP
ncbi:MAG: hypothetical protein RIS76_2157 [Verrucomicrobiota bacterium]